MSKGKTIGELLEEARRPQTDRARHYGHGAFRSRYSAHDCL